MAYYDKYYCNKCGKEFIDEYDKWCKSCQINDLKYNFTNWTSGNEKIDSFIQERQLSINHYNDIVFEWIPYNHFSDIKEIGKNEFNILYSAIWNKGPLHYNKIKKKWVRKPNKKVTLRCLYNSQSITSFLNKVWISL